MSHGPPVGPLVVVGTPEQARVPMVPPEPGAPPAPTVPPVDDPPPSGLFAVIWQPPQEMPKIATSTSSFQTGPLLISVRGIVRTQESCYDKFIDRLGRDGGTAIVRWQRYRRTSDAARAIG